MSRQDTPPEDRHILSVLGCNATGATFCAAVSENVGDDPGICLIECQYAWASPPPRVIRVENIASGECRLVVVVRIVQDAPIPWVREPEDTPIRATLSQILDLRDRAYLSQQDATRLGMGIDRRLDEIARKRDELLEQEPDELLEQGPGAPDPTANPLVIELGAEDLAFIRMWGLHIDSSVIREKFDLLDVKAVGTRASRLRDICGEDVVPKRRKDRDLPSFI